MTRRFIIYVPSFDENIGGNIALHRLCDLLNRQGETARLWPYIPRVNPGGPLKSAVRTLLNWRGLQDLRRLPDSDCRFR